MITIKKFIKQLDEGKTRVRVPLVELKIKLEV